MVDSNKTNQNNYKNRQRFDFNVKDAFYSFVNPNKPSKVKQNGIDNYRSKKSINGITPTNIVKAIKDNSLRNSLKAENTYQESRCHAFYRMIGFPVYDGTDFYNPGYDSIFDETKKIKKIDKIKIASTVLYTSSLIKLFDTRESTYQTFANIFNINTSINASVLALSSMNKRDFIDPLDKVTTPEVFSADLDSLKQTYTIDKNGHVGNNKPSLTEYIGDDGVTPTLPKTAFDRTHILYPFLVDPRYSESVNIDKMLAVPFVLDTKNLIASETVTVEIPMLETIIYNRVTDDTSNITGELQNIKDYIENVPSIADESLIERITKDYKLTEQQRFIQYLNIMRAMINKLVQAQNTIEEAQKFYYWIPIPSTTGPEGGSSVRPIIITKELANNPKFITSYDADLIRASIEKFIGQTAASVGYESITRKPIFPSNAMIFNPEVNASCGDINDDTVKSLTFARNNTMKKACDALQIIEMIMGEFSGLGLCDILAIIASLYIMPIEDLLGFLDKDAFERMKTLLNKPDAVRTDNLSQCMGTLTNTVKDFFNLMDKLYLDKRQNNSSI